MSPSPSLWLHRLGVNPLGPPLWQRFPAPPTVTLLQPHGKPFPAAGMSPTWSRRRSFSIVWWL